MRSFLSDKQVQASDLGKATINNISEAIANDVYDYCTEFPMHKALENISKEHEVYSADVSLLKAIIILKEWFDIMLPKKDFVPSLTSFKDPIEDIMLNAGTDTLDCITDGKYFTFFHYWMGCMCWEDLWVTEDDDAILQEQKTKRYFGIVKKSLDDMYKYLEKYC